MTYHVDHHDNPTDTDISRSMHPEWRDALEPVKHDIGKIVTHLNDRLAAGATLAPAQQNIFRALSHPIDHTKVLVLGQDPYPSPGHAVGLAFSADRSVRPVPKSLANIYTELHDDLGITPAETPDLTSWDEQGVMLLNRVLTTEVGSTAAHRGLGWETVTDRIIQVLLDRHDAGAPLVAVLWGRDARKSTHLMRAHDVPVIESVHPSPLSAHRGFFGSRPFSRVNQALREQGADRIDWTVQ